MLLLLCCDSLDGQVARSLERRHVVCWLMNFVMVFICWASFCSGSLSSVIIVLQLIFLVCSLKCGHPFIICCMLSIAAGHHLHWVSLCIF